MTMKRAIVTGRNGSGAALTKRMSLGGGIRGPGASDTEIKIGNTMPYSGPASAYGVIGKSEAAYFAMINDQGGVNGRKINFISRDDGYSPPKTVELVRKLVEEDQVLLMFQPLGTPPNTAIPGAVDDNRGAPTDVLPSPRAPTGRLTRNNILVDDGWQLPSYRVEARIYARYILKNIPDAKIAVLYQNDDFGKDYIIGLREGLGDKADKMIVATKTYETTDPTVDSQIGALQGSGPDVLHLHAGGHFILEVLFNRGPTIGRTHSSRKSRVFRIHLGDGRGITCIVGRHPLIGGLLDGLRFVSTGLCCHCRRDGHQRGHGDSSQSPHEVLLCRRPPGGKDILNYGRQPEERIARP